ncbi:universal stress protein [Natronomonas salsuginis]|uniref:Universal stress protein n=1 Tax=Natronomonas salsuginis TaxID=2217661 RepID=A0A4U5JBH3_9EURY|nr:universal stress protein [Natronomonas salsuginis]TKR25546.1 universal stress protein [Natronomonas salsuginis]
MRVLVPVDGSQPSDDSLAYALEQFPTDDIVALYVMDPVDGTTAWGPGSVDNWLSAAEERSETVLEDATAVAADVGVELATDSVVGRPSKAIVEYAAEHDIDHIVIGSHGRAGISRVLLGSVAETVVRRAPVPVTVARPTAE